MGKRVWACLLVGLSGCLVSLDASLIQDSSVDGGVDQRHIDSSIVPDSTNQDNLVDPDKPYPDGSPADQIASDQILSPDQAPPDQTPPDQALPPDQAPPDQALPPDQAPPPCENLTCLLGCNVALDRCNRLDPSNFSAAAFFDIVSQSLELQDLHNGVINTDTGQITINGQTVRAAGSGLVDGIYWEKASQSAGYPQLSVFGMTSLEVGLSATFMIAGHLPLAIYLTQGADIRGTIVALPYGRWAIAGGFNGGDNAIDGEDCFGGEGQGGTWSGQWDAGGGGGGRKAAGGAGGDNSTTTGGGAGKDNGSEDLVPLYGGCGGGGGAGPMQGAPGGGGGGAIQISANETLTVRSQGRISMPGGGGLGGDGGGGGGGGSGGAILLEGASIVVDGLVAANGGSGGCGGEGGLGGDYGPPSTAPAPGCSSTTGGSGGDGGALATEAGVIGGYHDLDGGGGGGAAGLIRLNTPVLSAGNLFSPAPSTSSSVKTW